MVTMHVLGILIFLLTFTACTPHNKPVHLTGKTMGTTYNIKYLKSDRSPQRTHVASQVTRLLEHLNEKLSTWRKDSEISRFNAHPPQKWFATGEELHTVTAHALEMAKKSSGVFDPTLGPLVNLWGFGPNGKKKVPSNEEISRARSQVGYQKLHIKPGALKKHVPGMYLDLSASAKGYSVDRVAQLLEQIHIAAYMVEIGGEVKCKGQWKIGVEVPDPTSPTRKIERILPLHAHALASSGNYRNFFPKQNRNHSHIIDSQSGQAGKALQGHHLSVTVLDAQSCMNADAWATTLMAMGWEKGFAFAREQQLAAHFISRNPDNSWKSRTTDAFERMLKQ